MIIHCLILIRLAYGIWFHSINLILYLTFLVSMTVFVATYDYDHGTSLLANATNFTIDAAFIYDHSVIVSRPQPCKNVISNIPPSNFPIILLLFFCLITISADAWTEIAPDYYSCFLCPECAKRSSANGPTGE